MSLTGNDPYLFEIIYKNYSDWFQHGYCSLIDRYFKLEEETDRAGRVFV